MEEAEIAQHTLESFQTELILSNVGCQKMTLFVTRKQSEE